MTPSFCSSVAGPSRGGRKDSSGFLGTQGSPSWSLRLGRRPLVPSAGEMLTCCSRVIPGRVGWDVVLTTYSLSVCRLFVPAPSHPSPWPSCSLPPFLHWSAHPPFDPAALLSVHPPSLHVCPSIHLWAVCPVVQHIFSVRAQGQPRMLQRSEPWSLDSRKPFSESVLPGVSSVCVSLTPSGRVRRPAEQKQQLRALCGGARSRPQGTWAPWKEAEPSGVSGVQPRAAVGDGGWNLPHAHELRTLHCLRSVIGALCLGGDEPIRAAQGFDKVTTQ